MKKLIMRLTCLVTTLHFIRRYPSINLGSVPSWRTRARCWCGLFDVTVLGLCSREEAEERAKEVRALSGWGCTE